MPLKPASFETKLAGGFPSKSAPFNRNIAGSPAVVLVQPAKTVNALL